MLEFRNLLKQQNKEESAQDGNAATMKKMRKRILCQASLAIMTVILTVVIVVGMTAAWYTNVVHTGGLIFEVEKMGVNVDAQVSSSNFTASPGDEGLICLTAENQGQSVTDITVSIAKTSMEEEMRKRLFFYVDTQYKANGETAQRVYLNSQTNYTYTLFARNSLVLAEDYHNSAQLKWHWVYDVLGYYVLAEKQANGSLSVQEYLQPIEYDYDSATFLANGTLETVNGTTTAKVFLQNLSKSDGYPGTIDVQNTVDGYYKVAVDANGNGVYAYLCSYSEIEKATEYDTQLGVNAADGSSKSYTARMTVYAELNQTEAVSVSTAEDLIQKLQTGTTEAIKLMNDVTLPVGTNIEIGANRNVLVNLNGHTIVTESSTPAIVMEEGSSLTMLNGTMTGQAGSGHAFGVTGAQVTLNNVTLEGYQMGLRVADDAGNGTDSTIHLTNCNFTTTDCAVLVYGNGTESEQTSKVIIEGCKLVSDDIVICGNGTATGPGRWGTDIQIINSTITHNGTISGAAIYHPQKYGTLNVVNSVIQGETGIAIKGGTVTITNSHVTGTGEYVEPEFTVSGFAVTGAGVYVETSYNYDISLSILGKNTTIISQNSYAVQVFEEDAQYVTLIKDSECTYQDGTSQTQSP